VRAAGSFNYLKIMKHKILLFATVLTLGGVGVYTTTAMAEDKTVVVKEHHERHPSIHAAIRALEKARLDMKNAAHDFGGHREEALKQCDAAIEQLKLALQYDKD
jgi:hypothetical protein